MISYSYTFITLTDLLMAIILLNKHKQKQCEANLLIYSIPLQCSLSLFDSHLRCNDNTANDDAADECCYTSAAACHVGWSICSSSVPCLSYKYLVTPVLEIFHFVYPDEPVLCGVGFLQYVQLKVLVADLCVTDAVVPSSFA